VVGHANVAGRCYWSFRQNHVQVVQRKLRQQTILSVLAADNLDTLGERECGLEPPADDQSGHDVSDSHLEPNGIKCKK